MVVNSIYPDADRTRLAVVDNIAIAVRDGDSFRKVEIGDPRPTEEDIKRVILPFDNKRNSISSKIRAYTARKIAERETLSRNKNTQIEGLENIKNIDGGVIITCNHFNIMDNTVIRYMLMKCEREKDFHIVVQESNMFMKGYFGFLMRNCNTMPVSGNLSYMSKNLKPALREKLERGGTVLIYPEQEMWFNYRKPRMLREGAYYYAVEFSVPILPCFVEMRECGGVDAQGFYNVKHILHVMPPIYPDKTLSPREAREKMKEADLSAKKDCYERAYGIPLDDTFIPERDIAGYRE